MSRLVEALTQLFGRVEILAMGVDDDRRRAEQALAEGRALEARTSARAVLERVPRSPLGLALWADAAAGAWLDHEVVEALERLVEQVPWRQDAWLRLGLAGLRIGSPRAREAIERAATGIGDAASARLALWTLCDLDRAAGDPARALRWLDRAAASAETGSDERAAAEAADEELGLRRAECLLALGDVDGAQQAAAPLRAPRSDGRDRLLRAAIESRLPAERRSLDPIEPALAAYILQTPGAAELLTHLVAARRWAADDADQALDRVRQVLSAEGTLEAPGWVAAFAIAQGQGERARQALLELVSSGDHRAAPTLLALAVEGRDIGALRSLAERDAKAVPQSLGRLLEAVQLRDDGQEREALACLEAASGTDAEPWARQLLGEIVASWVPALASGETARWESVLAELRRAAWLLDRAELVAPIEALAVERERPLRVAIVGEFNAGKSTLLNALLGTDVAPTGVRPTTACLHWVAWAPDPFARVVVRGQADRVVSHADLKQTLREQLASDVRAERVFIYAPIERLKRIELIDTPGFNAPQQGHEQTAEGGIREAHLALWLLDATAPMKDSERQVLERIGASGVPVQVLVNKRDRVEPAQMEVVMAYVDRALRSVGLRSYRPPLGVSAAQALQGRLGDAEALTASGWPQVEQLLTAHIVDRSEALRERALRRKALELARELDAAAQREAKRYAAEGQRRQRHQEQVHRLAARLEGQPRTMLELLLPRLRQVRGQLEADVRPIEQLGGEARRDDDEIRGYLVGRTVARLAPVLCEAIAEQLRAADPDCADAPALGDRVLYETVAAAIGGAAAAYRSGLVLAEGPMLAAVEVALRAAATALRAQVGVPTGAPRQQTLPLRTAAVVQALGDEAS